VSPISLTHASVSPLGWRAALGWLIAVTLLGACTSSESPTPPVSSSAASSNTAAAESTSATTPSPAPQQNIVAWILDLAPGAPAGPPEFVAYRGLLGGLSQDAAPTLLEGCEDLAAGLQEGTLPLSSEATQLYSAVAAACVGALSGDDAAWIVAEQASQQLTPPTSCMDLNAYDLLLRLVAARRANPSGQFVPATDPASAAAPACPMITAIEPPVGPRGTLVQLVGTNLHRTIQVLVVFEDGGGVESDRLEILADDPRLTITEQTITFTIDDTTGAVGACIVAQGAPTWNGTGIAFTFTGDPTQSPTPTQPPSLTAPCPPPSGD
jgi:hypothetical protein